MFSVSESFSEENTTSITVSSCEEDSEYFSRKSNITQSMEYIANCYINFSPTMNFMLYYTLYYIYLYCIILYIKLKEEK